MLKLLTPEEIADVLRVDTADVVHLIDSEELHAVEVVPGAVRVQVSDLKAFLRVRRRGFRPSVTAE